MGDRIVLSRGGLCINYQVSNRIHIYLFCLFVDIAFLNHYFSYLVSDQLMKIQTQDKNCYRDSYLKRKEKQNISFNNLLVFYDHFALYLNINILL